MSDTEANVNDPIVTVALNGIPAERQISFRERVRELQRKPRVKDILERARTVIVCIIVVFSIALLVRGLVQGSPADINAGIELAKAVAQQPTALAIQQSPTWLNLAANSTRP